MSKQMGGVLADNNGFYVREIFMQEADGSFKSLGFAVFGPDGVLIQVFTDLAAAKDDMDHRASEVSVTPSSKPKCP